MCGIVGYVGRHNAMPILVEGLHRLEYRGYDSAGIAIHRAGGLAIYKAKGKVREMEARLPARLKGTVGIGHTRWATHGEPSDANAHPHTDSSERIALVHNGIIENASALRAKLEADGVKLTSETDTELLAHLIAREKGTSLVDNVRSVLRKVSGAYGIAVLDGDHPDEMVVARNGSPVVLGIADKAFFVASDVAALVRHTQQVVYLDDGEIARITKDGYEVTTLDAVRSDKTPSIIELLDTEFDKENFAHFMLKEIHEQPDAVNRTLRGRLEPRFSTARLGGLNIEAKDLLRFKRIKILGCGSAYIAGLLGAKMIERLARVPCDAEPAAEFRYRNPIIEQETLYFAVSQSGETFDTLAAVEEIQRKGGTVLGVVNSVGSTIARACRGGVYLHAGPEVAVVSTKTFLCTLTVFALIGLYLGRMKDVSPSEGKRLLTALEALPEQMLEVLGREDEFAEVGRKYARYDHAYFIGRNEGFAVAMEGALKLKEVSYIHAEAYPASELKHGPLALVTPETPTIAIVPNDDLVEKNMATIEEIKARRGPVLAIAQGELSVEVEDLIVVPETHELLTPILMLLPLQLIAYHAALARECDVDQPRNLAKSVTVE